MIGQALADAVTAELQPFLELPCVGGKLYLGSMFYLDFGGTFSARARSGKRIEIGEMTFSVRNVAWWLYRGDDVVVTAESVSSERFDLLVTELQGVRIRGFSHRSPENQLHILFDKEWYLAVDLTNRWVTDNDILEFALPNGYLIGIDQHGKLVAEPGFDDERAQNWARSIRRH